MFKDSEGREWTPRVTCGTVADFERKSGIKLLDEVGQMIEKHQDVLKPGGGKSFMEKVGAGEIVSIILSRLLGGTLDNALLLAFVSVKAQAVERDVSFDSFKDALDGDSLKGLIPEVKSAYESFFRSIAGDSTTVPGAKK